MDKENLIALLVEDDMDLASIFTGALQSAGYQTETILDGSQARQYLENRTPKIVILDLYLPGTSGIDILKYIRAEERLANTRVLVVTGNRSAAEEVRDVADFVLIKPISFVQLRDITTRLHSPQNAG